MVRLAAQPTARLARQQPLGCCRHPWAPLLALPPPTRRPAGCHTSWARPSSSRSPTAPAAGHVLEQATESKEEMKHRMEGKRTWSWGGRLHAGGWDVHERLAGGARAGKPAASEHPAILWRRDVGACGGRLQRMVRPAAPVLCCVCCCLASRASAVSHTPGLPVACCHAGALCCPCPAQPASPLLGTHSIEQATWQRGVPQQAPNCALIPPGCWTTMPCRACTPLLRPTWCPSCKARRACASWTSPPQGALMPAARALVPPRLLQLGFRLGWATA